MRKYFFTVFYIICFSVTTFCPIPSFAVTDNHTLVNNAITMTLLARSEVQDEQIELLKAQVIVGDLASKWAATTDEIRRKTVFNFVIEMMGSNFWATSGGLYGRVASEHKELFRNLSLMDLYSYEIEAMKDQIGKVKSAISVYNETYKDATVIVSAHHDLFHDQASPSSENHFVPPWKEYTVNDDLPSFSCSGNKAAGRDVCHESFYTPSSAFWTHHRFCGEEVDESGIRTNVPGDGARYYTCDPDGNDKHAVHSCVKNRTYKKNGDWVSEICGIPFRKCSNEKFNHHTGVWAIGSSKHSLNANDYDGEPPPLSWPPVDDEEDEEDSSSPGLYPVNASYITINGEDMVDAAPGDTVSVDLVMPADKGYSMIYWYLADSSDSGYGDQLGNPTTPSGNGIETELTHTFSMPSNASGVYTFTAYIYPHSSASDQTVYTYSFKIYCS